MNHLKRISTVALMAFGTTALIAQDDAAPDARLISETEETAIRRLRAQGGQPPDAQLISETEETIKAYNLTNHAGMFGVILLETFLRADSPEYSEALRSLLPDPSIDKVLEFSNSELVGSLRPHLSKIDHMDLVAFEYFSSEAAGLTFLTVGSKGPVAIEIRFYISPEAPEKAFIDSIILHDSWEKIRTCFSTQRKLPGSLTVTGSFSRKAEQDESPKP